jgi:hypothetical protein
MIGVPDPLEAPIVRSNMGLRSQFGCFIGRFLPKLGGACAAFLLLGEHQLEGPAPCPGRPGCCIVTLADIELARALTV